VSKKYTFIDLFAGCGGLSEGFLSEGHFSSLSHVEWEKPMIDTLRHRLIKSWGYDEKKAEKNVIYFDIQKTEELIKGNWSTSSIRKYGKYNSSDIQGCGLKGILQNNKVDLIIGGPPCQAYSIHGRATDKNSMENDYRNFLFESFIEVVKAFTPSIFVFENVPGILSAKPGGYNVTDRIYSAFDQAGYVILPPKELKKAIFNAVDYNVPQERKRVIIIGVKKDSNLKPEDFYEAIREERSNNKILTVKDAIGKLPKIMPLEQPYKEGRINISHKVICPNPIYTQHIPRYNSLREINVFREWVSNNMNNISHKKKIDYYKEITGHTTLYAKYKNLEWDKPSHTVVAHLSKDGMMFIHPDAEQARSITIREAAILMGFPLDYDFIGSTPYCYKMIGNAVPVPFATAIARGIRKTLERNVL
jgi:DNA (cytosine-5-)-methyltransferase